MLFATLALFLKWIESIQNRSYIYKLTLCSIILVLLLHWIWSRRHLYRFAWSFQGEFGPPYLGILAYIKGTHDVLPFVKRLFKKCQAYTICVWIGVQPIVLTSDPNFVESVLTSPNLLNKMQIYKVFDMLGSGLLSNPAAEWQVHRKKINPSFNHQVLLSFFPIFNTAKNTIVSKLEPMADDNKVHRLTELFLKNSMEISFETVMGKPMKENDKVNNSLVQNFGFLVEKSTVKSLMTFLKLDFLYNFHWTYNKAHKIYTKCVYEILQEKISNKKNNILKAELNNNNNNENIKKEPHIFLDRALGIYEKAEFTLQDVIGEANHIVSASFETTAVNMFSTLVLIAMHPLVQERLYEELLYAFPNKDFCMEYEHIAQLPYLDMVIKEGLRVFPPVGFIGRRVIEDTKIMNEQIFPKGIEILICIYHLHRRPDIWGPNADKFDPDNFLPDNERDRHKFAYIPFSGGLRNCIGWRYAMFLAKTMIAGIIRNYRIETDAKYDEIEYDVHMTIKFKTEPLLKVHRR